MATQSVEQNVHGPLWPLGMITVATAGTPVGITTLVDASNLNDPNVATSATSREYTTQCWAIHIFPGKPGASHGVQANTGNIYVMLPGAQGAGNRDDYGAMVMVIRPTDQPYILRSTSLNRQTFSPYRVLIDADNNGDGAIVTLVIPG